jgi:hypothetical protein
VADRAFIIVDCEQRTPEWQAARLGRVTGSRAAQMLATTKTGWAAGRENLRWQLVLERMTNRKLENTFSSREMDQGTEREPAAVAAYEAFTGHLVASTGFLQHTRLMAGASLDGHLGDFEVLVSVKCREAKAHAEYLLNGAIPKAAMEQMRHELWLTGARDHHYVSWNPDFPENLQLRIAVVQAAKCDLAKYDADIRAFLAEVDAGIEALRKAAA